MAVGNTFGDDYYGIVVSNMADFDGMYVTLNEHINRYRDSLYLGEWAVHTTNEQTSTVDEKWMAIWPWVAL